MVVTLLYFFSNRKLFPFRFDRSQPELVKFF